LYSVDPLARKELGLASAASPPSDTDNVLEDEHPAAQPAVEYVRLPMLQESTISPENVVLMPLQPVVPVNPEVIAVFKVTILVVWPKVIETADPCAQGFA